jgi:hypothetical protein
MPGIFMNNAFHDRQSLRLAIDYVYQPDYQKDTSLSPVQYLVFRRTLVKLA